MGRIQSSIGLFTGTDFGRTVDQLIAISARPRDRLLERTQQLQQQQQAISELTALVIGVQLAGKQLAGSSLFLSKNAASSDNDTVSVQAGSEATAGKHLVRTIQTAATHLVRSQQRIDSFDRPIGWEGELRIHSDGFLDVASPLESLNDGRGVDLGKIRITDRAGNSAVIDLTEARDVDDVLDRINEAGIGVRAGTVGSSIQLVDKTGADASHLKVEQIGDAETAADLGLWGINTADTTVAGHPINVANGGPLRGVDLGELNDGQGVAPLTSLFITLADGSSAVIDLSTAQSTSEVLDAIEGSGLRLTAGLNDARTGFRIRDMSGGTGALSLTSSDGTAEAIGLDGSALNGILNGRHLKRQLESSETTPEDVVQRELIVPVEAADTLETIAAKINQSSSHVVASVQSQPDGGFVLQIRGRRSGEAGRFGIDVEGFDLQLRTQARGRDALISIASDGGIERRLASADGVFQISDSSESVDLNSTPGSNPAASESTTAPPNNSGLVLTVKELSPSPVSITVSDDDTAAVTAVRAMVDQYNRLVDKLDSLTFFNASTQEVGLLFGSNEALRIRSGFAQLFSGRIQGAGSVRSASQMGIRLRDTGKLEFDESKFTEALTENRTAVEQFFATDSLGLADRLNDVAERIAGVGQGLLLSRTQTLASQVETNNSRIETLNRRLGQERERLLRRFQETEAAIARIQSSQAAIAQIGLISIPTQTS